MKWRCWTAWEKIDAKVGHETFKLLEVLSRSAIVTSAWAPGPQLRKCHE